MLKQFCETAMTNFEIFPSYNLGIFQVLSEEASSEIFVKQATACYIWFYRSKKVKRNITYNKNHQEFMMVIEYPCKNY